MSNSQSEKKNFQKILNVCKSIDNIKSFSDKFKTNFKVYRRDNSHTAINYLKGLFCCTKGEANMERMEEEVSNSEYRAYQHFISNSSWDWQGLQKQVAQETSLLLTKQKQENNLPIGYIIDESAHLKKGNKSVGASRQYAGVIGKVDNCQVGVYASLINNKSSTIINERIFLPKTWTEDVDRCQEAKIPVEYRAYKTKPALALDMIKQDIERGVVFDWIGGDGLYGHSTELCDELEKLDCFYVMDVHKDQKVFLKEPGIAIPSAKPGKGRKPTKLQPNLESVRIDEFASSIADENWKLEKIRDTVKGVLSLRVYKENVWVWDGESKKAKRKVLIITKTINAKPKVKYSISNGDLNEYTFKEYAYFIAQRYWVERSFDNAKNELGMSDYQIRKWQSWHTHHAIVMMASLYVTTQLIEYQQEIPLLSFRDVRIMLVTNICSTQIKMETEIKARQMQKRHKKRQTDIDFTYRKQKEKLKS
jgi:SRSO17 transposase